MKALFLFPLMIGGFATMAAACGPWLPSLLLTQDKQEALHSPKADFITELQHLPALPALPHGIPARPFDREEYKKIRQGDIAINKEEAADVDAALAYYLVPLDRRKAVAADYARVRRAMEEIRNPVLVRREMQKDVADILFGIPLPDDLPVELREYLHGAIAFHCGDEKAACEIWEKLLSRPLAERRFRSTWAAYMLGRIAAWDADDDEVRRSEARHWFEQVRTAVQEGCEDPMNLVGLSYYWEAQIQKPGASESEARLALLSLLSGCAWPADWLRAMGDEILDTDDEAMRAHAASVPLLRQLTTVSALLRFGNSNEGSEIGEKEETAPKLLRWLKAMETAGVNNVEEADRIAWAFYEAGNFRATATWLRKAPADAPMALWLRGKLALRAGHNAEAAQYFKQAARHFPATTPSIYPEQSWWWYEPSTVYPLTPQQQLQADLGITQLAQAQFPQALDALLHTGAWLDAAYVAEQVLNTKELLIFLNQHRDLAVRSKRLTPGNEEDRPPFGHWRDNIPEAFQYLVARRLAREGQLREARIYMPEPLLARFDEYRNDYTRGHDRSLPTEDRAAALWEAARIHRYLGMELFGSETAPDWSFYDGQYECDDIGGLRAEKWAPPWGPVGGQKKPWLPRASPTEIARNAHLRPHPNARFHYRYIAADLAWQAAKLRPPDEATARMLCIAGGWLKNRDDQAADRFYQELVGRCGKTGLGKEGEHLRWFPRVTDEPFEMPTLN
jgi:hypothetical protein